MIRTTKLQSSPNFPVQRIEMVIYSVSRPEKTINEVKIKRLNDVTHFLCPFNKSHQLMDGLEAITHVISCYNRSSAANWQLAANWQTTGSQLATGNESKQAKAISDYWTVCDYNSGHVFNKNFTSLHYQLQNCRSKWIRKWTKANPNWRKYKPLE